MVSCHTVLGRTVGEMVGLVIGEVGEEGIGDE